MRRDNRINGAAHGLPLYGGAVFSGDLEFGNDHGFNQFPMV
jgi:hypothetical protein